MQPIEDAKAVGSLYRYWRLRTFYAMYIGYIFYYFTRKSFTFIMPVLQEGGMSLASLGMISSALSLSYGCSKFFSGILGDRSNPRYFMAIGLLFTGACNLAFGLSSSLLLFVIFWGLNGWFQGWGWPGCAKLLTYWYSHKERGLWWGLWNTSHNLGGALAPLLVGLVMHHFDWRTCLFVSAFLSLLGSLFLLNRLRDTPRSLGLPPVEVYQGEAQAPKEERESYPARKILLRFVLKNPCIWILSWANFFVYVIRTAVNDWSFLYYCQHFPGEGYSVASLCCCSFEVGGLVGSLSAGWLSDSLFLGRRNPINVLYLTGTMTLCFCMVYMPSDAPFALHALWMFAMGFCIFGPQMLIGMAAAELSHKKAVASASGFTGFWGYLGAAFAGLPLGGLIAQWGWSGYFAFLSFTALLAGGALLPLWHAQEHLETGAQDAPI